MAELDHHKKQAKLYVRWHREGHYPVAAIIREHLDRFFGLSDQEILGAPFKLADAHHLVARRLGFPSWQSLCEGTTPMPVASQVSQPEVIASEPQAFVSDVEAALSYYTQKLGFTCAFSYGQPAFYAQVRRGGGRLNLRLATGPVFDADFLKREGDVLCATLAVNEAKPFFLEFQSAGVEFHQRLRTEPWGARTFVVRDPDGNLLLFAGD